MIDPNTRPSLIVRLTDQHDQAAWWDFVEIYEPFLAHLARRSGVPRGHVDDVTQQILMAVARSVRQFSDDGEEASFRRWIGRVARNTVIKYMTRMRRHVVGQGGSEALQRWDRVADDEDSALSDQYDHELVVWAANSVRKEFSESSWQAFWQTLIEGRNVDVVAQDLGLSRGAVYMARSRIVKRIRDKVAEVLQ